MAENSGAPPSGSGSQATPEAAEASSPPVSIPSAATARFEYRFSLTPREDGTERERHDWCLIGEAGGINIWAEPQPMRGQSGWGRENWFGGVECHWSSPPRYYREKDPEPHHERCWLLGKPCWHDGTSLYFSERIEHLLPAPTGKQMDSTRHQFMLNILRNWFDDKFSPGEDE